MIFCSFQNDFAIIVTVYRSTKIKGNVNVIDKALKNDRNWKKKEFQNFFILM